MDQFAGCASCCEFLRIMLEWFRISRRSLTLVTSRVVNFITSYFNMYHFLIPIKSIQFIICRLLVMRLFFIALFYLPPTNCCLISTDISVSLRSFQISDICIFIDRVFVYAIGNLCRT